MINVETLFSLLPTRFKNRRLLNQDVLRCEEQDDSGRPFALHYFAMARDLDETEKNLDDFQDEVIGRTYYETQGDLRWNHYLYFIADDKQLSSQTAQAIKARIERNRSYARKFVLTNEQLAESLRRQELSVSTSPDGVTGDVLNRWTERLLNERLDIVLEQKGPTETVRLIADGTRPVRAPTAPDRRQQPRSSLTDGFLSTLEIRQFRTHPLGGKFEHLGQVNLIVGSNGTGKTSFLEAIEYLFCRDNARISPVQPADICGVVNANGTLINVQSDTAADELKRRNLKWYGVRDIRGSSLANSFARFNFLSTDEAVLLAKDPKVDFDDLLSRLIAGPQAAELWAHILKVIPLLEAEATKTRLQVERWNVEKMTAQEQISNAASMPSQADHAFTALVEDLMRLEWKLPIEKQWIGERTLPALRRVHSITRELLDSSWVEGAISASSINAYALESEARIVLMRRLMSEMTDERVISSTCASNLEAEKQHLALLKEIQVVVESGVVELIDTIRRDEEAIDMARKVIARAGIPESLSILDAFSPEDVFIEIAQTTAVAADRDVFNKIQLTHSQLQALRSTRAQTENLLQDIQRIAKQLIEHQPHTEQCPVCRTNFDAAALRRRIEEVFSPTANTEIETLAKELNRLKALHEESKRYLELIDAVRRYAIERRMSTTTTTVSQALRDLLTTRSEIEEAERRLAVGKKQLGLLSETGLSSDRVNSALKSAGELALVPLGLNIVDGHISSSQRRIQELELQAAKIRQSIAERKQQFFNHASWFATDNSAINEDRLMSLAEQKIAVANSAVAAIQVVKEHLNVDDDATLAATNELLRSATSAAELYVASDMNERRLQGIEQTARNRLVELEANVITGNATLQRLLHACEVLNDIRSNDSLTTATEGELDSASEITAAIFSSIHSPREYGVQRGLERPLFKLHSGEGVSLQEVSTGQRAAFVLSLFLAMNAKLRDAPKVLLFDDPVAHIDDLNALSFLDQLRQLVITGRRQVFYATADARLAGLFEHKFGFLGSAFRRIDLNRIC